jgi:hypothetical protein
MSACPVTLKKGERYVGAIVNADGTLAHHVVLLAKKPSKRLDWPAAKAWAAKAGGDLPTRREQSLLFANAKDAFDAAWYWSSEAYGSDGAYAWLQVFDDGNQFNDDTRYEARVRAVRRVTA